MDTRPAELDEQIAAFIGDIRRLTPAQLDAIAALHQESADRRRAQETVLAQARRHGWADGLVRVETAVRDFCARQLAATGQEGGAGLLEFRLMHARRAAGPALIDAAIARIFEKELPEPVAQELQGPFVSSTQDH